MYFKENFSDINHPLDIQLFSKISHLVNSRTMKALLRGPVDLAVKDIPCLDPAVAALHHTLPVVDMHADALLWGRDLNSRSEEGHVDFPRLREGGVKVQLMGLPSGIVFKGKVAKRLFQLRGFPAWAAAGYYHRVLWQIQRLHRMVEASPHGVKLVGSPDDIDECLKCGLIGLMPAIEGAHCLESDLGRLDEFFRMGVRVVGLIHFDSNNLGGRGFVYSERRHPLTPFGRAVIKRMNELGIIPDLAHASDTTFYQILDAGTTPVIVSHTGVKGRQDIWRNITDDQIRAVKAHRGVIGIIYEPMFLGGWTLEDYADHIEHVIRIAGIDHIGLGSDWDGGIRMPLGIRHAGDLPLVTQVLWNRGFRKPELEKIMGGNFLRVFKEVWSLRKAD